MKTRFNYSVSNRKETIKCDSFSDAVKMKEEFPSKQYQIEKIGYVCHIQSWDELFDIIVPNNYITSFDVVEATAYTMDGMSLSSLADIEHQPPYKDIKPVGQVKVSRDGFSNELGFDWNQLIYMDVYIWNGNAKLLLVTKTSELSQSRCDQLIRMIQGNNYFTKEA